MEGVALAFGGLTVAGGLYMMGILLRTGRTETTDPTKPDTVRTRIPSWLVFSHGSLAVAALAVWIAFMVYDEDYLAWTTVIGLLVVAALGTVMFVRWLIDHHRGTPEERAARKARLAEQQIPSAAVHGHGFLAFVTILLVVLVALGIGR